MNYKVLANRMVSIPVPSKRARVERSICPVVLKAMLDNISSMKQALRLWINELSESELKVERRRDAAQRVYDCYVAQLTGETSEVATHLNLTKLGLKSLPTGIVRLVNLKDLDLWGNQLTGLPIEIVTLVNLKALWVEDNLLRELPEGAERLGNLEAFNLDQNKLTRLPIERVKLESLSSMRQALRLWVNELSESELKVEKRRDAANRVYVCYLAQLIGKKTQVATHLNLTKLGLKSLPTEIMRLVNLTDLNLWGNQLTGLPIEIVTLVNLKSLSVEDNRLRALPAGLEKLVNLEEFNLDHNQLTGLPIEIVKLVKLKELWVDDNLLRELPEGIESLVNLKELGLARNQLRVLPEEFERLVNLNVLYLSKNYLPETESTKLQRQWQYQILEAQKGEETWREEINVCRKEISKYPKVNILNSLRNREKNGEIRGHLWEHFRAFSYLRGVGEGEGWVKEKPLKKIRCL
ncbi:MAG: hypothetical protein CL521_05085 [Actinobacteria bacterium]|nr:hypothetical protein [Actinomycetota bacterium]